MRVSTPSPPFQLSTLDSRLSNLASLRFPPLQLSTFDSRIFVVTAVPTLDSRLSNLASLWLPPFQLSTFGSRIFVVTAVSHVLTPFVERLATEEEKRAGWCRRRC